jgi:hypothetical protein
MDTIPLEITDGIVVAHTEAVRKGGDDNARRVLVV